MNALALLALVAGWVGFLTFGFALCMAAGRRRARPRQQEAAERDRDAVLDAVFDADGMRPYVTPTADRNRWLG